MGQKVNPVGMRIGLNKDWNSRWFASNKEYSKFLAEDIAIRDFIEKSLSRNAYLSHIEIERKKKEDGHFIRVLIFVGRDGVVIGENGENVKKLKANLLKLVGANDDIRIDVIPVKNIYLDARIVADMMCAELEARGSFRIVQKRSIANVRKAGAKGCKTAVSGRLAGADIARTEGYKDGTMAINTLRSDIDYATREAMTTYGKLGVKIWICRGDVKDERAQKEENRSPKKGE